MGAGGEDGGEGRVVEGRDIDGAREWGVNERPIVA
jgi:hypothetical protein